MLNPRSIAATFFAITAVWNADMPEFVPKPNLNPEPGLGEAIHEHAIYIFDKESRRLLHRIQRYGAS